MDVKEAVKKGPTRAVVLSGGGARGAYEAGVLSYVYQQLPERCRGQVRILCGTSVGAIHACFLAAGAQLPQNNMGSLVRVWESLQLRDLLRLGARDLMRLPGDLHALWSNRRPVDGVLINVPALQSVVMGDIAWPQIQANLDAGLVDGLTVSATHIHSGKNVVFVDRAGGGVPPWTRDQRRVAKETRIGPMHALASAAIPILFPPIAIDGAYYCDGGLRQNTPLSPALRLGADRVLVVAVGHGHEAVAPLADTQLQPETCPGASLVVGKVLNALLLDHLDYDLAQLRGFNRLLEDGQRAFGPSFLTELSATAQRIRGQSYREVDALVIRPSRDLGQMAMEYMETAAARLGKVGAWLLRKVAAEDEANNSDLLSYLLFDGAFAAQLIALGMQDADAQRDKLLAFFKD